jgi:hypothetical protein
MPRKVFTAGEVLAAADVNEFLQDQAVMTFAGTAARGSAIPTPVEGMVAYLNDSNSYESYTGAAWVPMLQTGSWTSYTPTLANLTLGNGTLNARYAVVGKTLFFYFQLTLGSTSAVGSGPTISFPAGITSALANNAPFGFGTTSSIGGNRYAFVLYQNSSSNYSPRVLNASATYIAHESVTATVPVTWATGQTMYFNGTTEID